MRSLLLPVLMLCLSGAIFAAGREAAPVSIKDAASPDGKYTLAGVMEGGSTCRIEVKAKSSGKAVGKLVIPGYDAGDHRDAIAAIWKEDSSACALNISLGHSMATCRVLAGGRGSWSELSLADGLDRVRKEAGKAQGFVSAEAWLPDHNLKVSDTGNNGVEVALVYHLIRFGKPRLEILEIKAQKTAPGDLPRISELPCTFRVFAGAGEGSADGPAATAQFKGPSGVAIDSAGNLLVADRINETLRRIDPAGTVETLAGSVGEYGTADGAGNAARFWYPQGLATDAEGNVYVADTSGKRVRKVTPQGQVTTLAKGFKYPTGVAVDGNGNVYVADATNSVVQKIARDGTVSTVAGKEGESGAQNGRAGNARFHFPCGVGVAADGTLYVAEQSCIRKIDAKGNVTTFAGSLEEQGRTDGTGANARFWGLTSLALDKKGNLYVADHELKNLRRITSKGVVQTIRAPDHADLPLQNPVALAVDTQGRIYVADQNTQTILLVEPVGTGSTTPK